METGKAAFTPYIPADRHLRELGVLPVVVGTVLGMIFGASSLYLVLKVGLTVSASIPVAVISVALFTLLSRVGVRNATILENNVVQTAGSAGESIAFGVGVTMPAILILGFDLSLSRTLLVSVLGALLGILMMIPLRRALIVQQHGTLKYPEGTACAVVLKASASEESRAASSDAAKAEAAAAAAAGAEGTSAKTIFTGFGIGLLYSTLMKAFLAWKEYPEKVFGGVFKGGSVSAEISPALLGVGYIIGPRIASTICAGGVLSYLVLIPMIKYFGDMLPEALAPGTVPISEMSAGAIRNAYVLYIGAGAVAAGGIISVMRSLGVIGHGLRAGLKDASGARGAAASLLRTERDLSMRFVLVGIIGLLVVISSANPLYGVGTSILARACAAVLIVIFGFLFVTVSARLTGEIGSSSNPISGMTVATLLLTCLCFLILGWTGNNYYVTALSIGGIVCIAAANGGATAQDLKTGFLVGATPRAQQISILIGATASAIILGPVLLKLNQSSTVYVPVEAPSWVASSVSDGTETLAGPQGLADTNAYRRHFRMNEATGNFDKYLVDDSGTPRYLVDPGINGTVRERPDGTRVDKFDAPKATLMSYIIKGILDKKLPWGLVILGAMIAIVLEMLAVPSLAFAVGVYLPISSSSPIFMGGVVRWAVDRYLRRNKFAGKNLSEDQLLAETDKSPGVLMASGYIAGGAIAGIIVAFLAGVPWFTQFNHRLSEAAKRNPFAEGPASDVLALIPFAILIAVLYLTGRELILKSRRA